VNLVPDTYKIIYNGKDITRDISDHITSITYTDKVEGESDEIEIELEDRDGMWQNDWFPAKGDTIEVQLINNGLILSCGKFTLDEKKLSSGRSNGDVFQMSGLAASITKKLRTKRSTPHENKTLRQIAQAVADRHGLKVQGTIPDIRFSRITQNRETDLSFLNRIAEEYGLLFSIRDSMLVFQDKVELENKKHILSLDKTEVSDYEFTDKTENTYKDAKVSYHNPEKNEYISYDDDGDGGTDTLTVYTKVENQQHAERKAKAALHNKNTRTQTCSVSCPGNVLLLSGVNVELTGFGKFSCIGHVTESKHSISRSDGYTVSFEAKKVNIVSPSKHKPKRKTSGSSKDVLTGSDAPRASALLGGLIEKK
jgi:phage protein D